MKNYILSFLLVVLHPLWAECPLILTNEDITPTPLLYPGNGKIKIRILNNTDLNIPVQDLALPTCKFIIDLQLVKLKNDDTTAIFANFNLDNYFDITYFKQESRLEFVQKIDIPSHWYSDISIPVYVIRESDSSEALNGFDANILNMDQISSRYTYTTPNDIIPDYTAKISLIGASGNGLNRIIPAILTVTELNSGVNSGELMVRIPKHDYISFEYDATKKLLVGKTLDNSSWELIDSPTEYHLRYIGESNHTFPIESFSKIGLEIRVNPSSGVSGSIDFKLDLDPIDNNPDNDSASAQIDYTN